MQARTGLGSIYVQKLHLTGVLVFNPPPNLEKINKSSLTHFDCVRLLGVFYYVGNRTELAYIEEYFGAF